MHDFLITLLKGMSIFETKRRLRAYREGCDSAVNEQATGAETSSSLPQIRRDKALGWIPNPRTPMNLHESFYVENVSFLAVSKRRPVVSTPSDRK